MLGNNNKAYKEEILGMQDSLELMNSSRITYRLTIKELRESNDLIIRQLKEATSKLGIKEKELLELRYFKANVKTDTTINIIKNDSCEFSAVIAYNPQTVFEISSQRVGGVDSLKHKATISASFSNIVHEESEWKEPNFFKRLFLFK